MCLPAPPTWAPTGKQPHSLIGAPGLAGRASQITAWLVLPTAAPPSSGYQALPEGGLAPDKGCHSASLRAEPTTQGWLGAGQSMGKVRRPGSQGTWAGDRAMVTTKTHLPASGRPLMRGFALGRAPPVGTYRARTGTWLDLSPSSPRALVTVHNLCNCTWWPW